MDAEAGWEADHRTASSPAPLRRVSINNDASGICSAPVMTRSRRVKLNPHLALVGMLDPDTNKGDISGGPWVGAGTGGHPLMLRRRRDAREMSVGGGVFFAYSDEIKPLLYG